MSRRQHDTRGGDAGTGAAPLVLFTPFARHRQVAIWRERANRAMRAAHELALQAWERGEHQVASRWDAVSLKLMGYAERCRLALSGRR